MPSILFFFGSNVSTLRLRYTLVNDFQAKGWKVLYAASAEVLKVGKTLCPNVSFVPFDGFSGTSIGPINNLRALASIRQLLRTAHPDVLFLGNVKPNVYGGWIAAHLGFKQIYGLVSGLGYAFIDEPGLKRKLIKHLCLFLYKHSFKNFSHVFFQNPDDRALFLRQGIVTQDRSSVVPGTGVDLQAFYPQPYPQKLTFLMAARLIKEKGVFHYIEAAQQLKKRYPQVEFLLGGGIDANPSAISREQLQTISQQVQYVGYIEAMASAINRCSVFVYPSYYREGVPRALLEALACGRPIITTDAIGCREAIIDRKNGIQIPIKDTQSLAQAMEFFITHPDQIVVMGNASRCYAHHFEIHRVNEQMHQKVMENLHNQ